MSSFQISFFDFGIHIDIKTMNLARKCVCQHQQSLIMCHTQKLTSSTIIEAIRNMLSKKKEEKKFAEKKQLCYSFHTFLKTQSKGMGKKSATFWDKIDDHYNKHHLTMLAKRIARLLETKLGTIKYNVNKCGKVWCCSNIGREWN